VRQSHLFKIRKLDYNFLDLLDELDSEELDDLSVIDKAAYLTTSVYDLLQQNYDDSFCRISLPDHLRFYLFKNWQHILFFSKIFVSLGAHHII
jgi:hypothetical protein